MNNGKGAAAQVKTETDFLIVNRTGAGYRVYPASKPTAQHVVKEIDNRISCTCDAFAEDDTCEHVRAVLGQLSEDKRTELAERKAIQEEKGSEKKKTRPAKTALPTTMTVKRSISPDGRIDSLSVEFCCGVDQVASSEITARAVKMLKLQSDITSSFLKSNGNNGNHNGRQAQGTANGGIPATMLHVGSTRGRYGPRLFIAFQAGKQGLKLFGTAKQLAEAVSAAGYRYEAEDIAEGISLNLPCQVLTKPARDPRYTDIEQVLPSNGSATQRRSS